MKTNLLIVFVLVFLLAIRFHQNNSLNSVEVKKTNTLPNWMTGIGAREIDVVVCNPENMEQFLLGNLTEHNIGLVVCEEGRRTKAKYQPQFGLCATKAIDIQTSRCIEGLDPSVLVEWMKQTNHPEFWDRP